MGGHLFSEPSLHKEYYRTLTIGKIFDRDIRKLVEDYLVKCNGEGRDYSYDYVSYLSCKAKIMQVSSVEYSSDEICNKMSLLQLASKSEYKFGIGIIYSYCYMYIK